MPRWTVADALAAGRLARVLAEHETPAAGVHAVYPTNRLMTPLIREFVEHVIGDLHARGVPA